MAEQGVLYIHFNSILMMGFLLVIDQAWALGPRVSHPLTRGLPVAYFTSQCLSFFTYNGDIHSKK